MRDLIHNLIGSGYGFVVGGMGCRAMLQAALVVLLARSLGHDAYGASVAIISVAGFFSSLVGWGASAMHLRDLAVTPHAWRHSLLIHHGSVWRSQLPLLALTIPAAWFIVHAQVGWLTLLCLVTGDMMGIPVVDLIVRSYQGRDRYLPMAAVMCLLPALRLAVMLALYLKGDTIDLVIWGYVVLASGASLALAVAWCVRRIARDIVPDQKLRQGILAGVGFAMASASSRVHADADKAIVARLLSIGAAGDYSVAYRLMDVLLLPVNAAIEWSSRRLFQLGHAGLGHSLRVFWKRWLTLLVFTAALCVIGYIMASLLPIIFGKKYVSAVTMAHWLAALPLTTFIWAAMRSIAATSGHERLVGAVEMGGAGLSVLLGVTLVTRLGWSGAVIATYVTQLLMSAIVAARIALVLSLASSNPSL